MIFTVANISKIESIEYNETNQELDIRYINPHRASGGKHLQVKIKNGALIQLIHEIAKLDPTKWQSSNPKS
ncbi:MAG: hypothetical protein ACRESJ_05665 [Pseudomonas sp.]|uniref:hypothetical protein n=1 Tax=Pseudomonas sp. TaxID=306 RepID=UPI003D6F5D51